MCDLCSKVRETGRKTWLKAGLPLQLGKGRPPKKLFFVPGMRLLGRSRICCGLSHQWSAITGFKEIKEDRSMMP
ncbi:hypothetical protein D3Z53_05815 [Lachnospiraceae bacterium]|jgi:hypothetical protein|nr:hypothetical protein C808_01901 [Lachnospiraceae bacterium M18-1]MCI9155019.1 hypothetical protein [Ruminococcus sp.]NBI57596.1 hypothetical protein [Lachnospiraceae bacterium]